MTRGDLGVQVGRLIFETTMESVGEASLLTGEDTAKTLIEYLTLMQFSASWRVAILFSDACIDSVLDDIRRIGIDLLEGEGLTLSRDKIEKFQRERFGQYYAAIRQNASSYPSEVLAGAFLDRCTLCAVSSGRLEQDSPVECGQAAQDISRQLEQLDRQIDAFVLRFMSDHPATARSAMTSPHDESGSPSAGSGRALPVRVAVRRTGDPERDIYMELITADLLEDLNDLSTFSRTLLRGASIVAAGGVALLGYETFMGDWLATLVTGVLLLLAGGLANHQQCLKTARMRQKWTNRFSHLDADQLSAFLSELEARHPMQLTRLGL